VIVNVTGARISGRLELDARGAITLIDGRIVQAQISQNNDMIYNA